MNESIQIFYFLFSRKEFLLLFLLRLRYPTEIKLIFFFFINLMNLWKFIVIWIFLLRSRITRVHSAPRLYFLSSLLILFLLFNLHERNLYLRHNLSLLSLVNSLENLISQFQTNFYLLMFIFSEFHNILWSSSMF